jgi:beta-glucosidase
MLTRRTLLICGAAFAGTSIREKLAAQPSEDGTREKIEKLLGDMTLEEKIGQLTMGNRGGVINTETANKADLIEDIRAARLGSLVGVYGADRTTRLQRIALEETPLGIPLIFGLDVIHGYTLIFPVPLGETSAFDPHLWKRTAQMAAQEAHADGVTLTFAPMIDITRDPHWGRIVEGPGEDPWLGALFASSKVRGFQGQASAAMTRSARPQNTLGLMVR